MKRTQDIQVLVTKVSESYFSQNGVRGIDARVHLTITDRDDSVEVLDGTATLIPRKNGEYGVFLDADLLKSIGPYADKQKIIEEIKHVARMSVDRFRALPNPASDYITFDGALASAKNQGATFIGGGGDQYTIYIPQRARGGYLSRSLFQKNGNWHVGSATRYVNSLPADAHPISQSMAAEGFQENPLSTGAWFAIGLGVVGIGTIAYLALKPSTASAAALTTGRSANALDSYTLTTTSLTATGPIPTTADAQELLPTLAGPNNSIASMTITNISQSADQKVLTVTFTAPPGLATTFQQNISNAQHTPGYTYNVVDNGIAVQ